MSDAPAELTSAEQEIVADCLAGRIRLLNRAITSLYDDALRPLGLTAGQLNMLVMISSMGPLSPAELARKLSMEKSTLSRGLARLRKNGWIAVSPGGPGPRQTVTIEPSGRELIAGAHPRWKKAQAQALEIFGSDSSQAIRRAFDAVRARD